MKAIDGVTAMHRVRARHTGVPTFFRACCREASRGGLLGYDHPAYQLSRHLTEQAPDDADGEQWQQELDVLAGLLDAGDDGGVWAWFNDHYPKCMGLVPHRRRQQFVAGVFRAYRDHEIALDV